MSSGMGKTGIGSEFQKPDLNCVNLSTAYIMTKNQKDLEAAIAALKDH